MRQTFTLLVEFRGDMRGHEQRTVTEQIQVFAENQHIQTFGFESANTGSYAFKAHPDYIDDANDSYKIGVFRETLESWLMHQQDINSYTLQAITELSELFPKDGDGLPQLATEKISNRDKFLE